jgi:DNA replication protein DnaC
MNDIPMSLVTSKVIEERTRVRSVFHPYSLSDLSVLPAKKWLIEGVIGAKDLVMIYGASESGKTAIAIDMLFAVALEKPWANRYPVNRTNDSKRLRVAYCGGEGQSGLASRFLIAADKWKVDLQEKNLPDITIYMDVPQLFVQSAKGGVRTEDRNVATFAKTLENNRDDTEILDTNPIEEENKLDLIVIDTLHSASVGVEENSAKDIGVVLDSLYELRSLLGCTVVLVHHTGKKHTGKQDERGSSALRAAMDTIIKVSNHTISCDKSKDSEKFQSVSFKKEKVVINQRKSFVVKWSEPATESLSEEDKDSKTLSQSPATLSGRKAAVLDYLSKKQTQQTPQEVQLGVWKKPGNNAYSVLRDLEKLGMIDSVDNEGHQTYMIRK